MQKSEDLSYQTEPTAPQIPLATVCFWYSGKSCKDVLNVDHPYQVRIFFILAQEYGKGYKENFPYILLFLLRVKYSFRSFQENLDACSWTKVFASVAWFQLWEMHSLDLEASHFFFKCVPLRFFQTRNSDQKQTLKKAYLHCPEYFACLKDFLWKKCKGM